MRYGLRSIGSDSVGGVAIARSYGDADIGIGVRPVVILQSNIRLKKLIIYGQFIRCLRNFN